MWCPLHQWWLMRFICFFLQTLATPCHRFVSSVALSSLPFMVYVTFRASLHGVGGPQVSEVTRLGGVTRLFIQSLILIWSRLHVRWGNPPHVTSPTWGPPPSCKQARFMQTGQILCWLYLRVKVWLFPYLPWSAIVKKPYPITLSN